MGNVSIYCLSTVHSTKSPGFFSVFCPSGEIKSTSEKIEDSSRSHVALLGLEKALQEASQIKNIDIYTDSMFVYSNYNNSLDSWIKANWIFEHGHEIENKEIWKKIHDLTLGKKVTISLIRHSIDDKTIELAFLHHKSFINSFKTKSIEELSDDDLKHRWDHSDPDLPTDGFYLEEVYHELMRRNLGDYCVL